MTTRWSGCRQLLKRVAMSCCVTGLLLLSSCGRYSVFDASSKSFDGVLLNLSQSTAWEEWTEGPWKDAPRFGPRGIDKAMNTAREKDAALVVMDLANLPPGWKEKAEAFIQSGGRLVYLGLESTGDQAGAPDIPLLSPDCRQYTTTTRHVFQLEKKADIRIDKQTVACPAPRSEGWGGGSGNTHRWVPLVDAMDRNDDVAGSPVSLWIENRDSRLFRYGRVGLGPFSRPRSLVFDSLRLCEERLKASSMLLEAGPGRKGFEGGERVTAGIRWLSGNDEPLRVAVEWEGMDGHMARRLVTGVLSTQDLPLDLDCGLAPDPGLNTRDMRLRFVLRNRDDSRTIDMVESRVRIFPKEAPMEDHYWVTTKGSTFGIGKRPFVLNGVNYWPVQVVGSGLDASVDHWLEPSLFDLDILERDLAILEGCGVNAIAFPYTSVSQAPQLRCVMEALRRRRMLAIVHVQGLQPFHQHLEEAEELIRAVRLWEHPEVMAIDLAWHPVVNLQGDRELLQPAWEAWVDDHWGFHRRLHIRSDSSSPFEEDESAMEQFYRQFLADRLTRGFRDARQLLENLGCRQLLTARVMPSPSPTPEEQGAWFVPPPGAGSAMLDFVSLGSWGLDPDRIHDQGRFDALYAKGLSGGKPVLWIELGTEEPDPARLKALYNMAYQSDSAGAFFWWYTGGRIKPGGPDYGMVEPDGTLRPSGKAIRTYKNRTRDIRPKIRSWKGRHVKSALDDREFRALRDDYLETYADEFSGGVPQEVRPIGYLESHDTSRYPKGLPFPWIPDQITWLNALWTGVSVDGNARVIDRAAALLVREGEQVTMSLKNIGSYSWRPPGRGSLGVYVQARKPDGATKTFPITNTRSMESADVTWKAIEPGLWTFRVMIEGCGLIGETLSVEVLSRPNFLSR